MEADPVVVSMHCGREVLLMQILLIETLAGKTGSTNTFHQVVIALRILGTVGRIKSKILTLI